LIKIKYILFLLPFFLVETISAAEMYRWVDNNGKVHYTDTPSPLTAKSIQKKDLGSQVGESQVPYSLQQAIKSFPVICIW
jgi:hypothetical protein